MHLHLQNSLNMCWGIGKITIHHIEVISSMLFLVVDISKRVFTWAVLTCICKTCMFQPCMFFFFFVVVYTTCLCPACFYSPPS